MLMRGRDLWVFLPNVSQPVRLSLSQRLTGQVPMATWHGRTSPGLQAAAAAQRQD